MANYRLIFLTLELLKISKAPPVIQSSILILISFIAYSFVWSIIGNSWSKVDQIWSITPVVYTLHILAYTFWDNLDNNTDINTIISYATKNERLFLISSIITIWGIRLTYNFYRRGGYGNLITHEEDYRWNYVRKIVPGYLHLIFNFSFIAFYQNLLLWLVITPVYAVSVGPTSLNRDDYILATAAVIFILIETIADQQQYNFQSFKYALDPDERIRHPSQSVRDGFLQTGLFKYSRHPAYFGEQSFWVTIYLFSIRSLGVLNWTIIGPILYILLFVGSIEFTESITISKYPSYKNYKRRVSRCVPWFPLSVQAMKGGSPLRRRSLSKEN